MGLGLDATPPGTATAVASPASQRAALQHGWLHGWPMFAGVVLCSVAFSCAIAPALAWGVGLSFGWRLLAMSALLPAIVAPLVAMPCVLSGARLESGRDRVRQLTALLPVCAWCRQVRDDAGAWQPLEHYVARRLGEVTTHAMCPDCMARHFPEA